MVRPAARAVARPAPVLALAALGLALLGAVLAGPRARGAPQAPGDPYGFTHFGTEPVRPLALSPDGSLLFAANTADDRVQVFAVTAEGLEPRGEVGVGLRPVALALRGPAELWVSNHLSDSVSVLDVSDPWAPRLLRTHAVGDEPRDIVVAGAERERVFVATARRSSRPVPGAGDAAVWVFDARRPAEAPRVIPLAGTKPRGLAVSPDGRRVYAAIFRSGNGTTVIDERVVDAGPTPSASPPGPPQATASPTPEGALPTPRVGRILHQVGSAWLDAEGRDWRARVPFRLPDNDVWVIDAAAEAPALVGRVSGVGTVLFNLAVRPGTGEVWVTNTEARNTLPSEPAVRGRAVDSRITRLLPQGSPPGAPDAFSVLTGTLNAHLAPAALPPEQPLSPAEIRSLSLSQPTDLVFSADGQRVYAAVFGSNKVAVLDGEGRVIERLPVGAGPGGLALDEARGRIYVLNHLEAGLSIVELATGETRRLPLAFDPTPPQVRAGEPFLFDAARTSGRGDQACASCHIFGDMDGLAWDLGLPGGPVLRMPFELTHENFVLKPRDLWFHPEKGPMMTQSLRGLAGTGPLHWRGDRFAPEGEPASDLGNLRQFQAAFVDLLGREQPIDEAEMLAFSQSVLALRYPPNPLENLDRSRSPEQEAGATLFSGSFPLDSGVTNCAGCHPLPLGTNGRINFEGERSGQDFKAPHFRNLYEKAGRFDRPVEVVSGYGFGHDGSIDTIERLLSTELFAFPGDLGDRLDRDQRSQVAAFLMAFDTGMAPAVGRQRTLAGPALPADRAELELLETLAAAGDCNLIARGRQGAGPELGWLFRDEMYQEDRRDAAPVDRAALLALAAEPGGALTFTCVPPGDGERGALDRDRDGFWNGDERAAGSDPADPHSRPDRGWTNRLHLPYLAQGAGR